MPGHGKKPNTIKKPNRFCIVCDTEERRQKLIATKAWKSWDVINPATGLPNVSVGLAYAIEQGFLPTTRFICFGAPAVFEALVDCANKNRAASVMSTRMTASGKAMPRNTEQVAQDIRKSIESGWLNNPGDGATI